MRTPRSLGVFVVGVVLGVLVCSFASPAASAPTTSARSRDAATLRMVGTLLGLPLGLDLSRSSFSDLPRAPDAVSSVYFAPSRALSDEDYLELLPITARALVPMVFELWPGVESFDICLEPFGERASPEPRTQLLVERGALEQVDWSTVTMDGLLGAAANQHTDLDLYLDDDLRAHTAPGAAESAPEPSDRYRE